MNTVNGVRQGRGLAILVSSTVALFGTTANAAPFDILWWDSTPEYGSQAADPLRKEMSDYLSAYDSGSTFNSTYVGSETQGTLSTHLGSNSYDVIVFDATSSTQKFNSADTLAVQNHYTTKSNLMLDGSLYIRNISFSADTDFPGPGGGMGGFLINQMYQLATRGGGIMVGTDHNCCQVDANQVVQAVLPNAQFSGITNPSTDGVFYGDDLLNSEVAIAANDVLTHWEAVPSQAIAPTGLFSDFLGTSIELFSQVDVADKPGGGEKFSYISTSWAPGSGTTDIDDDTRGGSSGGNGGSAQVPEPASVFLLGSGLLLLSFRRRRGGA